MGSAEFGRFSYQINDDPGVLLLRRECRIIFNHFAIRQFSKYMLQISK